MSARLDPFAALGRLFGRFSPPLARVFRRFWASTLALRLRIEELSTRVYGWFLRVIRPAVQAIYPIVRRAGRMIATAARWLAARLARSFETVRRVTAPTIRRTRRMWNLAFGTVTAPFRRAAAVVRRGVSRRVLAVSLYGPISLGVPVKFVLLRPTTFTSYMSLSAGVQAAENRSPGMVCLGAAKVSSSADVRRRSCRLGGDDASAAAVDRFDRV